MAAHQLGEHVAVVRRDREVAPLEELIGFETWPGAVHRTALDRAAHHHHHATVPVIRAAVAVLGGGTSELRHRDDDHIRHAVAEIAGERRQAVAELIQQVRELTNLVGVMVPAVEIDERDLDAHVRLDETRQLLQAPAKFALVEDAVRWCVGR